MSSIDLGNGNDKTAATVSIVRDDGSLHPIGDVADFEINFDPSVIYDPNHLLDKLPVVSECKHPEDSLVPPPYDGSPADPDDWSCIDCGYRNVSEATRRNTKSRFSNLRLFGGEQENAPYVRILEHLQGRAGVTFSFSTERSRTDQEFLSQSSHDLIFAHPPDVVLTAHFFDLVSVETVTNALYDMDTIVKRQARPFRPRWRMTHETFYKLARAEPFSEGLRAMPGIETLLIGNPIEYLNERERDQQIDLVFTPQSAVLVESDSEHIYRLLNLNTYPTSAITLPTFRRVVVDS